MLSDTDSDHHSTHHSLHVTPPVSAHVAPATPVVPSPPTTLPNLFKSVSKTVAEAGYNTISGVYENIRAIPYGLVVVGNDNLYGVIDLAQKGKEILSVKYENLEFIQNSQEFFMSADSTVGLLDRNGTIVFS